MCKLVSPSACVLVRFRYIVIFSFQYLRFVASSWLAKLHRFLAPFLKATVFAVAEIETFHKVTTPP